MTATQKILRRNVARKVSVARPVTETLLELVYLMHTTRVVGVRETPNPRPRPASARAI